MVLKYDSRYVILYYYKTQSFCACVSVCVCVCLSGIGSQTMRTTVMKPLQVTQWVQGKVSDYISFLKDIFKVILGQNRP